MRGPLKVIGVKNEKEVLKKLGEEYDFSLCLLVQLSAQLLTRTNKSLSWNKWVMQEFHKIMMILKKLSMILNEIWNIKFSMNY